LWGRYLKFAIIHTAATKPSPLVDFTIPSNEKMHYLPKGTKASDLLQAHESNVAAFPSESRSFDCEQLKTVQLHLMQANFDHMVRIGFFVPAAEKDVSRLKNISA
jgi:hypothetical protein